jgi:radical SAM protein (TIGR01212 family)
VHRYNTYRSYLTAKFGKPVLKIALNGGFSCPNRDGTLSAGGCSFCDVPAFSPAAKNGTDPLAQLRAAIARAGSRFGLYLPYLQPFSNTYGSVERLRTVYEPLMAEPGVVGLSIGTRPDCFSPEIYTYLAELAQRTYLCVELGLQSASDTVLARNHRGHSVRDFERCVGELALRGIETVVHMLFGLPGDTAASIIASAERLADLPLAGIKLHQLMIIEGTQMAAWYRAGAVSPLSVEQYADLVVHFVARLRPDQHIHRLAANSHPDRGLLAPLWSCKKGVALSMIERLLEERDIWQGCLYTGKRRI